ncbi:MAG: DUF2339 domain-containing protein [Sphingomonadaceae bacterium]
MLDFLLFVIAAVALRYAIVARREAHRTDTDSVQLKMDVAQLRFDLESLEHRIAKLQAASASATAPQPASAPPASAEPVTQVPRASPPAAPAPVPDEQASVIPPADLTPEPSSADLTAALHSNSAPEWPPSAPPAWVSTLRGWLFGGNLVAKLGLLILFIGISFLLKYTAARVSVPIEFRLAAIVLADLGLLAWAWRIRHTRPAISLPIQGTALAILMLVTFGAFRLYHLIPGTLAFALLFTLTAFTCTLAALQDALWLAIFGITGGFAAPLLASSGGGSHIGLFSYYALLNCGIFGLALLRTWRPLNLIGFAFTFAIGTAWGVLRYEPAHYISTQLFLLLFFLYYVAIALSYARQQSLRLKHYVDGTLIFGTPLLAFSLQFSLVHAIAFGVAYSALALGLFYIALALLLGRRRERYGLLVETFLALGIVFGTLAIPFALDDRWTSAAWALEGAGMVWGGLRQQQRLAWMFGLLVQAAAWLSYVGALIGLTPETAAQSNLWIGFLLLAATAFLMATRFRTPAQQSGSSQFTALASIFLFAATVWLMAGAWTEIFLRTDDSLRTNLLVMSALTTALLLVYVARQTAWALAGWLAVAVQAVAALTLTSLSLGRWTWDYPLINLMVTPLLGGTLMLAATLFSSATLMRQRDRAARSVSTVLLLWSGLWWFMALLPSLVNRLDRYSQYWLGFPDFDPDPHYWWAVYLVLLAAVGLLVQRLARRLPWQELRWYGAASWCALAGATLSMLAQLYTDNQLPRGAFWLAYLALWLASEWQLRSWPRHQWQISTRMLTLIHSTRTAGPWLMIWPVCAIWIARWLNGDAQPVEAELLADAGWHASASWARFIPAWLMMAAIAWLIARVRAQRWPVTPLQACYRDYLIPLACGWSLLLVAVWNVSQNGAMAPLPYVPLANPLDLTSCFAMLLALSCYRMLAADNEALLASSLALLRPMLAVSAAVLAYGWFNLALLRTVSNYLAVPYTVAAMFASQLVQMLLSLVWSVTALLLMRHAAQRAIRLTWLGGAVLLGIAVLKLFLVDLSNVGSVERIISFLGVGALMVGIGYLAPYPSQRHTDNPVRATG